MRAVASLGSHFFLLLLLWLWAGLVYGQHPAQPQQADLYQRLLSALRQVPIIDNHSHPALPGDPEMDALTFESAGLTAMEPFALPVRLRPTNREYLAAFQALYGYTHHDFMPEHLRELAELKRKKRAERGGAYFAEVLNQAGIRIALANRVGMNTSVLDRDRFKWIPFVDPYLFPLNNSAYKRMNPDYQLFFSSEEKLRQRYLDQVEAGKPRTFDAYLRFLHESLERLKVEGAIALKFEAAYLRPLNFADPSQRQARRIYERYRNATNVPEQEYRALQDYLFRYILREAAKLKLPVHIHTGWGIGNAFRLSEASPLELDNIFSDPLYRQTIFVLLHGGYPFTREAAVLAGKPNVYVDTSALSLVLAPEELARILKEWLMLYPEKILFGTGALVINEVVGAEETYWLAVESGLQALALALSQLVQEGHCSEEEVVLRGRLMLQENAATLYGLPLEGR